MEYSKLVAVTGMPGLYELVSSKNDGAIVKSLEDNSTKFASSRIHNFSHLESIEVYTVNDNVNLVDVFNAMEKAGGSLPDAKDNAKLKQYFEATYPDMDFERVYASDLKKMVKWFEVLKKNNVEIKLSELPEEEEEETAEVEETPAPAKKTAKKKEVGETPEAEEKAPKKKAAPKKEAKAKEGAEEETKAPAKKVAAKKK
ncbi:MAG: hypothetical protein EOO09_08320 [Chitinophagaceae bacterium]|nr:MAG: hypothetical protein EOO09_08320 [Chitinophagaceae bacterium]